MANNFDWQTEDNFDWDQLTAADDKAPLPQKRRWWPYVVVILLLLGATATLIWRQVQQRVDNNLEAMRADIISSHNLINFAAAEQDNELFVSLLSGRDSNWTQAQNKLFDNGLLQERAPFGLQALATDQMSAEGAEDNLSIEFSPDLLAAELLTMQPYEVDVGNGVLETVMLQQSHIYRQGRERWLLSPPESDYWGETITLTGPNFTLSYPERDAEVGERLMEDLQRKLGETCQMLGSELCASDHTINLHLTADPAALAETIDIVPLEGNGRTLSLSLPAPSLVGMPVDEAGYQALFRGYGIQAVTAVTTHLLGYNCCQYAPLYRALLDYQLSQLSLKPWPVNAQTYRHVLDEQLQFDHLIDNWRDFEWADSTWENTWPAYAVIDFLLHNNPNLDTTQMQVALDQSSTLYRWLDILQEEPITERAALVKKFDKQLWQYAYAQGLLLRDNPPLQAAQQDLYLLCSNNDVSQQTILYRFQTQQEVWTPEYTSEGFVYLTPLPSEDAVVLHEYNFAEEQWQTALWMDNQKTPMTEDLELLAVSFGQTDPSGQLLTAYTFREGDQSANINAFELDRCGENGCNLRLLPSIPTWSPDGQQAIFADDPNGQLGFLSVGKRIILFDPSSSASNLGLFYGERDELLKDQPISEVSDLEDVGRGFAPFWIDEQTYGYLQNIDGRSATNLLLANTDDDTRTTLLQTSALQAALPDDTLQSLVMRYALPHPTNPQILFVIAFDSGRRYAHVFTFDRQTEEVSWLMASRIQARQREYQHELSVSGDGRYLVLSGFSNNNIDSLHVKNVLQVYDTQNNQTVPFITTSTNFNPISTYDWSQDGHWLSMILDDNQLALYAPEQDYLRIIAFDFDSCTSPVWVNQTTE